MSARRDFHSPPRGGVFGNRQLGAVVAGVDVAWLARDHCARFDQWVDRRSVRETEIIFRVLDQQGPQLSYGFCCKRRFHRHRSEIHTKGVPQAG